MPLEPRQIVLKVEGAERTAASRRIDLEVRQGEILGIVGVAGNGQKPLVEMICGLRRPPDGSVRLLGMEWRKFFRRSEHGISP